jgi:hypothetical protein
MNQASAKLNAPVDPVTFAAYCDDSKAGSPSCRYVAPPAGELTGHAVGGIAWPGDWPRLSAPAEHNAADANLPGWPRI